MVGTSAGDGRPLTEKVYALLRAAIIAGELEPGSKLVEQSLADQLQVSRVPVREAMPMLEAEGLVKAIPRRGTFVARLTIADVHDLFDLRENLEVLAARRAAERADMMDVLQVAELREVLLLNRAAVAEGDPRAISRTSAAFHRCIVDLSGNQLLGTVMRPINSRVEWLFRITIGMDQQTACDEHGDLVRAILTGNADLAASIAREHIARSREPSVAILASLFDAERADGPAR
jgi:DNA-binding GntR family transcriptional regulator